MPGGLSRIAGDDRQVVSGQRGGSSKDTWVLSDAPVERRLAAGRAPRADARGDAASAPTSSRAAEHLFWLGRYAERSENSARLLRAVLGRADRRRRRPGRAPSGVSARVRAVTDLLDTAVGTTATAVRRSSTP